MAVEVVGVAAVSDEAVAVHLRSRAGEGGRQVG